MQFLTSSQLILGEQLREEIAISDIKKNNLINDKVKSKLAKKLNRIHNNSEVHITFVPRGLGLSKLTSNKRHNIQTRRRFMLLGQTLAGQQAFDIIQCIRATRSLDIYKSIPLELWGDGHTSSPVSYTHLRAHETGRNLVCRLLLEKKKFVVGDPVFVRTGFG